jgi:hypothetical protein
MNGGRCKECRLDPKEVEEGGRVGKGMEGG